MEGHTTYRVITNWRLIISLKILWKKKQIDSNPMEKRQFQVKNNSGRSFLCFFYKCCGIEMFQHLWIHCYEFTISYILNPIYLSMHVSSHKWYVNHAISSRYMMYQVVFLFISTYTLTFTLLQQSYFKSSVSYFWCIWYEWQHVLMGCITIAHYQYHGFFNVDTPIGECGVFCKLSC